MPVGRERVTFFPQSNPYDEQRWVANAPLLVRIFDASAYPTAARVGTAASAAYHGAYSPEYA